MFKFVVEKFATEYKWKVNLSIYSSVLPNSKTSFSDTDYLIYIILVPTFFHLLLNMPFSFLKNVDFLTSFNFYLAAPRPCLGHYRGDSLTHPMLITPFLQFRSEGHREAQSAVWSLSPVECLVGFEPATLRFYTIKTAKAFELWLLDLIIKISSENLKCKTIHMIQG